MFDFSESALEMLPAKSREKFVLLLEERRASYGGLRLLLDQKAETHQRLLRAQAHSSAKIAEFGSQLRQDEIDRLQAPVKKVEAELQSLKAPEARATAIWEATAYVVALGEWLKDRLRDRTVFRDIAPPAINIKGDALRVVNELRQKISEVSIAFSAVKNAPYPLPEINSRIAEAVDRIAELGTPHIHTTKAFGSPFDLEEKLRIKLHGSENFLGDAGASFFVWIMRDEIIERLTALAKTADYSDAKSDAQRADEMEKLLLEKLELERLEEAAIVAASAIGQRIHRRRDADPRAVLEIEEA